MGASFVSKSTSGMSASFEDVRTYMKYAAKPNPQIHKTAAMITRTITTVSVLELAELNTVAGVTAATVGAAVGGGGGAGVVTVAFATVTSLLVGIGTLLS